MLFSGTTDQNEEFCSTVSMDASIKQSTYLRLEAYCGKVGRNNLSQRFRELSMRIHFLERSEAKLINVTTITL